MTEDLFAIKHREEKCRFLDECPAFRDYKSKSSYILNPDFHKYCVYSQNEIGFCPLYDYQTYLSKKVLSALTRVLRKPSSEIRGMTARINKSLEGKVKTE